MTKTKRKTIPGFTLAELDQRDGVERSDHLTDPLDKYLAGEDHKAANTCVLALALKS
ncbi:hypothetical protein [Mesorhizobium sp.]|uniref:hypothetical protein n=1 Tax=Mesorhizobium sp. TaxID=1871066 RepID=UPI00257D724B|nr:hypothetical protein [Mesorhizobium sp.]